MRIALVAPDDHSIWLFRKALITKLIQLGHEVDLYCKGSKYIAELKELGTRHIEIPFERRIAPISDLVNVFRLRREFLKSSPDIVHTFTAKPNIFGVIAAKLAGVPKIFGSITGLGAIYLHPEERTFSGFIRHYLLIILYRVANRFTERVWFQNPDDIEYARKHRFLHAGKEVLIRSSGIDLEYWKAKPNDAQRRSEIREALGYTPDDIVVIAVSRAQPQKGVSEFIEASRARSELPLTYLLVGGSEAPNSPTLSEEALTKESERGNFQWLGHQHNVRDYLLASDIVVHASYYREGVPRILLEAMALGLPIISTDSAGCREVIYPLFNGLKVQSRDIESLKESIHLLSRRHGVRKLLGTKGFEFVSEYFSERLIAKRILSELYQFDSRKNPPNSAIN